MDHKIFRFTEVTYYTDFETEEVKEFDRFVQEVSTRRISEFRAKFAYEYGYVSRLIDDALFGNMHLRTSRKYRFGDCGDWYYWLKPYRDCADPIVEVSVEIWL